MQALSNGGEITVKPSREVIEENKCICIRVSDTGDGIPEAIKDQIFDSFLTNRPQGTGLGLSIVKRILKSHGGDIVVEETSKNGTTMKIWIPAAQ